MNIDIHELETADYDILENIKVAFVRLWKQKIIVILVTLIGLLAALVYIGLVGIQTNYRATASIYSAVYGSYQESESGIEIMNTYASLLGSQRVCDRAAVLLQGSGISSAELKSYVSSGKVYLSGASSNSKSYSNRLVLVSDMAVADNILDITNAMAKAFTDEINDMLGTSTLQVMDEAIACYSYETINPILYFILFGAAGFVLSAGIIFVIEFFSAYVYSVAQCEMDKELILGVIPYNR